jgi:hypothetical protein
MSAITAPSVAPRRGVRTYTRDGRECYADTGRPVDEQLGSHVLLWIVDDPEAWAKAVEADGDAELGRWPKRQRCLAEDRRAQAYESAAQIRAEGPRRSWHAHFHNGAQAEAYVADLRRTHPHPGVRYEVAPITAVGACPSCHQPTIEADGQVRHHTGRYPAECLIDPEPEPERVAGEFEVNIGTNSMTCGYCDHTVSWPQAALGHARLTGFHLLGIYRPTNELVVLAEATTLSGATAHLPHHCLSIPEHMHRTYAPDAVLPRGPGGA